MRIITVNEYADLKGVTKQAVYRWIDLGLLEGIQRYKTGPYLIPATDANLNLKVGIDTSPRAKIEGKKSKGRPHVGLPQTMDEARKRYDYYHDSSIRRVPFTYDELYKMFFEEDMTLRQVANLSGVSHQAIDHIYRRFFAPFTISNGKRRQKIREKRWLDKFTGSLARGRKTSLLKNIVENLGFKLEPVRTEKSPTACNNSVVKINGKLCRLYHSKTPSSVGEKNNRLYYRANVARSSVDKTDFIILMIGKGAEGTFVIPTQVIDDNWNTERRWKTLYAPVENLPAYNNQYQDIDYWKYWENWRQLENE